MGMCGITGDMIKAGGEVCNSQTRRGSSPMAASQQVDTLAWKTGTVPEDWRKALVTPVHKGIELQCTN